MKNNVVLYGIDFNRRVRFCEEMEKLIRNPNYLNRICFSDETSFSLKEYENRHPSRYSSERTLLRDEQVNV